MDLGLTGKVAVITGGSMGIGKAAAIEFAREGASVVICARGAEALASAEAEIRAVAPGDVLSIQADVREPGDVANVVATTIARFGRLDILVNNAGTAAGGRFESISDDAWDADLDLKLMGAVRFSRDAIPHMRAAGGGRIINITHVGGKQPGAGSLPSSVSRAAGIALTKAMSKELAAEHILVNTLCVGTIKSAQIERAATSRFPDLPLDQAYERMATGIPLGRVGEAREVAALIAFLASPLGGFITGTAINVDGGVSGAV
ncbi:MAG: SDR family NAD(P)-dependent oxidoreductase [Tepidiformaceae bacterium]